MNMVWAELSPELDNEGFFNKFAKHVDPVVHTWGYCPLAHTEAKNRWYRPVFCKCKPYGGLVSKTDWGAELKHFVDYKK
jgi:hypothetical protein